jgi:cardiolipin synthase
LPQISNAQLRAEPRARSFIALRSEASERYGLLVGSDAFWRAAEQDMRQASRRLLVQAMTFEADAAGAEVARAIAASRARDRRVLVDDFTRHVVSDRLVWSPAFLTDRAFRAEVKATRRMFRTLDARGVQVRRTNPMGALLHRFPFRNHKKLIVADDVAYIGGLNFSDHNFAWPDLMLRISCPEVADALAQDFEDTFAGQARGWSQAFGELKLYGMDGRDNAPAFAEIFRSIDEAQATVTVVSPYLTFPCFDALERAAARGVRVQVITPLANNKPTVRDYLLHASRRTGVDVRLRPEMIHLKGMLIDGRRLVLGSSNFDFVSYLGEEELVAVIDDASLAASFHRQVIAPALVGSTSALDLPPSAWRGARSRALLRTAEWLIGRGRGGVRRAVSWT